MFELFIKQIFPFLNLFLRQICTCVSFRFSSSQRSTIPDTKILLLSDLQNTLNSIIFFPISAAQMSCLKSFVPQCSKIYPGLFDIVSCLYDLMSLVVTPLKSFVTNLLLSSDNYQPFTSLTKEQLKTTVTGSFFLGSFFLSGL